MKEETEDQEKNGVGRLQDMERKMWCVTPGWLVTGHRPAAELGFDLRGS
jgi:hypothetical protein